MMKKYNMLTDHPGKALLLFALPMIFGNLFQQFYNITDSVIVGRYVGEQALAAVGASYSITNVFIAIAIGGGIGSSVVISQFLGAGNLPKMKTAVFTTLINFLAVALFLGIFGALFNDRILQWVNTPEDIFSDAAMYLAIYFFGLPFLFMYNVEASIFNSLGDSKTPLYLLIFSSLLNICLDMVFVIYFDKGVFGVAVATLIAQGAAAMLSFCLLMKKLQGYGSGERYAFYDKEIAASMVKIAIPSTLQQSIVHMGILLVQSVVNSFGSAALAGYSAGTRIESLSIVPMLAMGNAMSTFTAQNIGAGKMDRVKEGYKMCYITILSTGLALCVMYQFFGGAFVHLFLEDGSGEAYSVGLAYVKFLAFFYSFIGLKATTDGLLRGAGDVAAFTFANLVNLSIRVIVTNVFAPVYGISVAWMAVPMGWAANYLISFSWYLTGKWKRIKVIER
ncbi:MAG: MATE family efflux transporter [Lachnospiraceae bacterium]|jgi:putative MATE family efflux protein|nr:MATE family efflux transporter [Lachnospiraceae bacterium]NBJ82934.1 MATE family efflux transporter [bacterium 1XD42-76]NBK06225.1 MATE family efflux transporter [bacterium 1XD42-94]